MNPMIQISPKILRIQRLVPIDYGIQAKIAEINTQKQKWRI
jgi:hypothetical protein